MKGRDMKIRRTDQINNSSSIDKSTLEFNCYFQKLPIWKGLSEKIIKMNIYWDLIAVVEGCFLSYTAYVA